MECVLVFSLFGASLCTLVVFFAICAEVARAWNAKGSGGVPFSICPDGGPFAIPTWPVVVCVCTVIDDPHRNSLDHIPGF